MAVTGKQVFDIAIVLMDEVGDAGLKVEADSTYYKNKTPQILTVLQTELLPSTETPVVISDLTQELKVSDRIALQAMPYGLASHLLLADGNANAGFFNARYEELKKKAKNKITQITDVYNVNSGMEGL